MTQKSCETNVKKLITFRQEHRELACDLRKHIKLFVKSHITKVVTYFTM